MRVVLLVQGLSKRSLSSRVQHSLSCHPCLHLQQLPGAASSILPARSTGRKPASPAAFRHEPPSTRPSTPQLATTAVRTVRLPFRTHSTTRQATPLCLWAQVPSC